MRKILMFVLLLAASLTTATAQSQQELIEMYRSGALSQSQIDNLQKQQRSNVARNRQANVAVSADANKVQSQNQMPMQQMGYLNEYGQFVPAQQPVKTKVDTSDPRYKE